jgi:hypothetical protein
MKFSSCSKNIYEKILKLEQVLFLEGLHSKTNLILLIELKICYNLFFGTAVKFSLFNFYLLVNISRISLFYKRFTLTSVYFKWLIELYYNMSIKNQKKINLILYIINILNTKLFAKIPFELAHNIFLIT